MTAPKIILLPRSSCFIGKIDRNILRDSCWRGGNSTGIICFNIQSDIETAILVIKKFSASVADSDQEIEETSLYCTR